MTRIAIVTPNLTSADAVSNDVLAMQRLLSERGHEVNIFSETSNLSSEEIRPHHEAHSYLTGAKDVLIYHHSIGWGPGVDLVKTSPCRKIVKYHNVTPPEFFEGISDHHRHLCHTGKSQLKEIVAYRPDLFLAASDFNKQDIVAAGRQFPETFVVPPFNQADRLQSEKANLEIVDKYSDGSVNLMTVGGVRPNKGHAALIEAFAIYYYNFNRHARLFIVGAENEAFAPYTAVLRQLINSWSIESRVVFTEEVSNEALKAYYLIAHALLMTSEHEGFCVPLAEAMAMKVPIIAYASTAIPETTQDAGLIWEERDPYQMAQSIDSLLTNESAKMALVARGSERFEENFSGAAIERRFLKVTAQAGFLF